MCSWEAHAISRLYDQDERYICLKPDRKLCLTECIISPYIIILKISTYNMIIVRNGIYCLLSNKFMRMVRLWSVVGFQPVIAWTADDFAHENCRAILSSILLPFEIVLLDISKPISWDSSLILCTFRNRLTDMLWSSITINYDRLLAGPFAFIYINLSSISPRIYVRSEHGYRRVYKIRHIFSLIYVAFKGFA